MNRHYAPIKLTFKMYPSGHPHDDGNWFVSIVYNYTENEWLTLFGMIHSYAQVMDKLNGVIWGFEAVQAYQEEHGNLKFLAQQLNWLEHCPVTAEVAGSSPV